MDEPSVTTISRRSQPFTSFFDSVDQSALTGEFMPIQQGVGEAVMSGSTNAGEAFHLLASRRAAESTYAGIIRLVEAAQHSRAPMSRRLASARFPDSLISAIERCLLDVEANCDDVCG